MFASPVLENKLLFILLTFLSYKKTTGTLTSEIHSGLSGDEKLTDGRLEGNIAGLDENLSHPQLKEIATKAVTDGNKRWREGHFPSINSTVLRSPSSTASSGKTHIDSTLNLPLFRNGAVTDSECKSLQSKDCSVYCHSGYLEIVCFRDASDAIRQVMEAVRRLNRDKPIYASIPGNVSLTQRMFAAVNKNVLKLDLNQFAHLDSRMMKKLHLPNLLSLWIYWCNIKIFRGDLDSFPKLTEVLFTGNNHVEIEEGSFDGLFMLKRLSLEWFHPAPPFSVRYTDRLEQLHCDCTYSWLRGLFGQRPFLLQARSKGALFNVSGLESERGRLNQTFVPVDCAHKSNLLGSRDQNTFAINDEC